MITSCASSLVLIGRIVEYQHIGAGGQQAADAVLAGHAAAHQVEQIAGVHGIEQRAAVELAKDWRTERRLGKLEALLAVADKETC